MQVNVLLQWLDERWRWSDASSTGGVGVPKESVSLDIKRAFPFGLYGRW
jgi:hypothetical protein